jgi:hypothetical protein
MSGRLIDGYMMLMSNDSNLRFSTIRHYPDRSAGLCHQGERELVAQLPFQPRFSESRFAHQSSELGPRFHLVFPPAVIAHLAGAAKQRLCVDRTEHSRAQCLSRNPLLMTSFLVADFRWILFR